MTIVTAPGATIIGATVTTDQTGHGAPIDHGAPTGPIVRKDRIGPTDPTGRTDQIVRKDQIVQTGPIGLIAADRQSTAPPGLTCNPATRTALAARRRRRRPTVSSRAGRAAIPDRGLGIYGLYNSGRNLLSNSYAASDYVVPSRLLTGDSTNKLASDDHEITFNLADLRGQTPGADGVFRPGGPQGTGRNHRPASRPSDRRYRRRCEGTAISFCRRRPPRSHRTLRCRGAPGWRMDRPARTGLRR